MNAPEPITAVPLASVDSTLQRIRTVAVISALSAFVIGVLAATIVLLSLYPSLRTTAHNLERVSDAMAVSAENFAGVSDEAVLNLVETSANLSAASANLTQATANLERNSVDDRMAESIIRLLEQRQEQFNNR